MPPEINFAYICMILSNRMPRCLVFVSRFRVFDVPLRKRLFFPSHYIAAFELQSATRRSAVLLFRIPKDSLKYVHVEPTREIKIFYVIKTNLYFYHLHRHFQFH